MISVVLPVYNTKVEWLKESIISVMNQSFPFFELIIVNDCSSDPNTLKYLKRIQNKFKRAVFIDDRVKVINLKENLGIAGALNAGIKESKYEWIARQDADDISFNTRFERQLKYLYKNPQVDVLGTYLDFMWIENNEWYVQNPSEKVVDTPHPQIINKALTKNSNWFINHPTVIFRKKAWEMVGGYDESLRGLPEDFDLWIRMIAGGVTIHNLQESLCYYRTDDKSLSHNFDKEKMEWFWNKHIKELREKL